jgi:Zn-dependent peptidase ImmA (M78 family)
MLLLPTEKFCRMLVYPYEDSDTSIRVAHYLNVPDFSCQESLIPF